MGSFSVAVEHAAALERPVDVVFLTTKSTALPGALEAVSPAALGNGVLIPLLNGVAHLQLLRERYGLDRVIAGTIRVGAGRVAPGQASSTGAGTSRRAPSRSCSRHARHGPRPSRSNFTAAGIATRVDDDEATILWSKLSMIATSALAGAAAGSLGAAQRDPAIAALTRRAIDQFVAAAAAEGASLSAEPILRAFTSADPRATSSLQRDLEAGLPIELDAIAAPAIRAGTAHGLDVSALEELRDLVAARAASVAAT